MAKKKAKVRKKRKKEVRKRGTPAQKVARRRTRDPGARTTKPKKSNRGLNEKQILFVEAYVQTNNALQSALTAGYSPRSAGVQGHTLLKSSKIKSAISERRTMLRKEIEAKGTMTKDWILQKLRKFADVDPYDIASWVGNNISLKDAKRVPPEARKTLSSLRSTKHGPCITFSDRIRALDLAASILGYKTDKHEHTGPGGGPIHFYLPDNKKRVQKDADTNGEEKVPESDDDISS